MKLIENLKLILLFLLALTVIWFYKDYTYQKHENQRQTENITQLRKADSIRFTQQTLTQTELNEYLQYQNPQLLTKLQQQQIKLNRIQSLITQQHTYTDDTLRQTNLSPIAKALKNNTSASVSITDSTPCLTIKGTISYHNDSLRLNITERKFTNTTQAIAYWERRPWKFLGIKTRFLGKKQYTAKVFDNCGQSQIVHIEKSKN